MCYFRIINIFRGINELYRNLTQQCWIITINWQSCRTVMQLSFNITILFRFSVCVYLCEPCCNWFECKMRLQLTYKKPLKGLLYTDGIVYVVIWQWPWCSRSLGVKTVKIYKKKYRRHRQNTGGISDRSRRGFIKVTSSMGEISTLFFKWCKCDYKHDQYEYTNKTEAVCTNLFSHK